MGWHELQLGERREKKKERKRPWRYIETLVTTPLVPSIRYWLDEFNDTKKERSPIMIRVSHSLFKGNWIITMKK
jgi:hypothetical protein